MPSRKTGQQRDVTNRNYCSWESGPGPGLGVVLGKHSCAHTEHQHQHQETWLCHHALESCCYPRSLSSYISEMGTIAAFS